MFCFAVRVVSTSVLVYVVDLPVFPAICVDITDKLSVPVNRLSTSVLVYVVDLLAFPAIAVDIHIR